MYLLKTNLLNSNAMSNHFFQIYNDNISPYEINFQQHHQHRMSL